MYSVHVCFLGSILWGHVGRIRIENVYPVQLYMIMFSRTCILGLHVRCIRTQDVYIVQCT